MFHALADRGVSCALVHGPPGIGKTALVDFFLRRFDGRPEVVVLRGRCHERESLPYRAVDNIIDELTERLLTDPTASPGACAAGDWGPLVQMFPTLGRVPWLSRPAVPRATASQSQEMRQSAVESLRALLRHLADGQRVVIVVDDLQWLDTDGAALLGDLIAPPDPPCLLLVACYRDTTPFSGPLRGLLTRVSQLMTSADCREIAVGALKPHETQELAQRLLSRTTSGCLMVSDVVRESRGDPFLLGELVRHVEHSQGWMRSHVDLEAMIAERVERLSGPAQQLLTLLAVAGHPLEVADACRASGVRPEPRILGSLSAEHLVRSSGEGVARTLEPYHDRLREVLVARLSTVEHTACHRQIAETLADAPDPDPQTLFMHFDAAGDAAAACAHVLHAAERAVSNLAFDTAARLYRRAFELNAVMPDQQPATHRRLAEALANAGRSVEAAAEFQVAAGESAGLVALDLRRHAAELLLRAGRLEEGCRVLTDVLAAVGLRMPRTAGDAKRMVLRNLLWLRLHGTRYRERQECDIAPEELARLDVCWSATILVTSDTVRGTPFIMQFPRLALQTGEPCRVSLALAQLAMLKSFAGNWAGALESFGRAEALALRAGSPQARGYVRMCVGFAHAMRGAWRASLRYSDEADAMLREQTDAVRLERSAGQPAILAALFFLGELDELARRVPQMIEDARRSEDAISAAAPYTYFGNVVWLAADDVEPARRYAAEVLARFPTTPYLQQHLFELIGSAHIDLYEGDGRGAARRLNDAWPGYRRSLHSRTPFYRAYMHHLRARAALAAIQTGADPAGLTRLASQEARTLERERMPWCDALASFLRAGLAAATGQSHEACACLQSAITQAESADMPLFATAGRRCLGQLLGAAAGRVLIREADAWMTNRGIRVPQRFAAMLVPGFCRREPV
ncbi:MAG: AAA family ATPase [Pirellulaceae bacterium]|nr:AAA family ATPase [Pirellulaceae bacterium]